MINCKNTIEQYIYASIHYGSYFHKNIITHNYLDACFWIWNHCLNNAGTKDGECVTMLNATNKLHPL